MTLLNKTINDSREIVFMISNINLLFQKGIQFFYKSIPTWNSVFLITNIKDFAVSQAGYYTSKKA